MDLVKSKQEPPFSSTSHFVFKKHSAGKFWPRWHWVCSDRKSDRKYLLMTAAHFTPQLCAATERWFSLQMLRISKRVLSTQTCPKCWRSQNLDHLSCFAQRRYRTHLDTASVISVSWVFCWSFHVWVRSCLETRFCFESLQKSAKLRYYCVACVFRSFGQSRTHTRPRSRTAARRNWLGLVAHTVAPMWLHQKRNNSNVFFIEFYFIFNKLYVVKRLRIREPCGRVRFRSRANFYVSALSLFSKDNAF